MPFIETKGICKTYGQKQTKVEALKPAFLTIEQGEFVAVMGRSGSGKSTLMHLLGGLEIPTAGEVVIEGVSLYEIKEQARTVFRRRRLGFVFQFFNLVQELTAYENILLPLLLDGQKPDEDYLKDIVDTLNLGDRLHYLPGALSGGQQQRVAIARALVTKPAAVLLDEPTGNLDGKSAQEIMAFLRITKQKYSQTLVMVTHDVLMAESASRILYLNDGVLSGSAGEARP
jgi:putative ABC transport system ATP-binding protein